MLRRTEYLATYSSANCKNEQKYYERVGAVYRELGEIEGNMRGRAHSINKVLAEQKPEFLKNAACLEDYEREAIRLYNELEKIKAECKILKKTITILSKEL